MQKKTLSMRGNPPVPKSSRDFRKGRHVRLRRNIFKVFFKFLELISIVLKIAQVVFEILKK